MKSTLLICFALLFSISLTAEMAMTLPEAKAYARIHSRELMLQQYEVDKAKLKVKEALSSLLPQVNGNIDYTHYGQLPTSIIPAGTFGNPEEQIFSFGFPENVSAQIEMQQVIFNGVFLIGLKGADVYVDMIAQEKAVKEEELADKVVRAFYNVLVTRESEEIIAKNISNLEKLLYETEQVYKNGLAEELDIDRLKLSLSNLNTQVSYLKKQTEISKTLFKFTIGMPVDSNLQIVGQLEEFLTEAGYIAENEIDFSGREEMKLFDIRENINQINVKRYRAGYYPSMSFFAALGSQAQRDNWNFFKFSEPWYNTRLLGVGIKVPIWDSFAKRSQVQSAKVDIERIKTGKEELLESYKLSYIIATNDLEQAKEELQDTRSSLSLAQKIYTTTQIKYREGIGSSLEMNTAESQLYDAQRNYVRAVYRVLIAKADIDKSLGKIKL